MIRLKQHYAVTEKGFMTSIENQTGHNTPLNSSQIWRMVLMLFNFMKTERGEEAAEVKVDAKKDCFMRIKGRSFSIA
jgi:hypothetical protein